MSCEHLTSARLDLFRNPRSALLWSARWNWCSPAASTFHPKSWVRGALAPSNAAAKEVAIDRLRVSPADCGLTERQVEVLALMTQGKSNKAIGRVLALAEPTVKNHVAAILKALKVKNRTEAAMAVVEYGWDLRRDEK
jgi:DNA-binding NarL/FixJ family response regulator